LQATRIDTLQVNLGRLCNMSCRHCHVDAGPDRMDAQMDEETVALVLSALDRCGARTLDLTGGAPELHPAFQTLVTAARARGMAVLDRSNLTILLVPRMRELPAFLAELGVEIVASLPHVRARNTDAQRGEGTFARSMEALRLLNGHGYGLGDPARRLTLVSNPAGAFLGADQWSLEGEWRRTLQEQHGVRFDRLFMLHNMPVGRFLAWLEESGNLDAYMARLVDAFNPNAVPGVLCRSLVSVAWDGSLYDCDFHQMVDLPPTGRPHLRDVDWGAFATRAIQTAPHCFGCTAGAGSSCGGATV
jgi:radical SAM/Cys-rich protein